MHALTQLFIRAVLLTLCCLATASVTAAEEATPPSDTYQQGSKAFNDGDYETALTSFLKARAQGNDSANLRYNLGVTYFKLERYDEAHKAFLESAKSAEMAPLAHYNLGLVALKQAHHRKARQWFQQTLDESQNPKLRTLAETMLTQMNGAAETSHPPPSLLSGFISGSVGFDSNVTLLSDTETIVSSDKNDQFVDFFAYGKARLSGDKDHANNLEASLYLLKYMDLSAFDTNSLRLGGSLDRRLKKWQLNSGLHYVNTRLDNEGYTQSALVNVRGRRKLQGNHVLGLRYEYSYIDDLDDRFAFLKGWRQKGEVESSWLFRNHRLQFSYQLELNNRRDISTTRDISFSPTRNSFRARADFQLDPQADATIDLRYRYSKYNDPTELADGSSETRRESRYQVILSISQDLKKGRSFSTEYRYVHNTSNFRVYDYNQHLLTVSLLWSW